MEDCPDAVAYSVLAEEFLLTPAGVAPARRLLQRPKRRAGYSQAAKAVVAYRELVRLRQNLSDEAARHKLEIQSALQVGFPEYREVFADEWAPLLEEIYATCRGRWRSLVPPGPDDRYTSI